MGKTITEKLLAESLVEGELIRGSRIGIKAHQTLGHDLNAVMTFLALESLGIDQVKTEVSVQYIDHNMLQADYKNADDHRFLREMTAKLGVICARPGSGICHQLHLEHFGIPGKTLIGGDSHTTAQGALAMFSVGVGGFDAAMAMAGEPLYITMPKIVNVRLTGQLQPQVSAKNIIFEVLRRLSVRGAVGKVLEYTGPGVDSLTVAERSTIANMGTETGATTSVFPSDQETRKWLRAYGREQDWQEISADADAVYDEQLEIDLTSLVPLIALPGSPDNVVPVTEVEGTKIDQVMLGSCTNTALNDILSIANILKGKEICGSVDVGLYPSTRTVIRESIKRGAYDDILATGVRFFEPSCGGCNGCGYAPQSKGVSIRTTPRNFHGRSGTKDDQVYLSGPEIAAASAITGVITDPRRLNVPEFTYELPEKFIEPGNLFYPNEKYAGPIHYGPNINPIPTFSEMPEQFTQKVLLKLPDNVTTDQICPAGALYLPIRSNIPKIAQHSFMLVDPEFPQRSKKEQGGILIAGENYGQGSSREQAAIIPRYLGISTVIAKGFARLHLANMVNWGLLPLQFLKEEDYQTLEPEDVLNIQTEDIQVDAPFKILNQTKGYSFLVNTPISKEELAVVRCGGRINELKQRIT
ncbi:aconitate hydratase [Enterococcus sp. 669A]|uniref:aconitate hydratase n=1 Tax=Candidatus Enterococcus moelleringii TaxID=2815325 RepID=A0ABS3L8T7_9ENTE|nr:aconitate hydratase [Enterococcus sp. 669A]MBO1306036.1 aconitate hydratase [Enterococcus sp. 669A]